MLSFQCYYILYQIIIKVNIAKYFRKSRGGVFDNYFALLKQPYFTLIKNSREQCALHIQR